MFKTIGECYVVGDLLGQKWAFQVVVILHRAPRKFNKISQILPDISPAILSSLLKRLCNTGIVWRDGDLYTLTAFGQEISKHIITFVKSVADVSKKGSSGDYNLLLSK